MKMCICVQTGKQNSKTDRPRGNSPFTIYKNFSTRAVCVCLKEKKNSVHKNQLVQVYYYYFLTKINLCLNQFELIEK